MQPDSLPRRPASLSSQPNRPHLSPGATPHRYFRVGPSRTSTRIYGVPLERIDVVRPGVDGHYRPLPAAEVAAFRTAESLPEQFLLHVGTLQPRKNIPVLLEALAQMTDPRDPVDSGGRARLAL